MCFHADYDMRCVCSFFLLKFSQYLRPFVALTEVQLKKLLWMTSFVNLCGRMHLTVHCSYELKIFMRISYITTVL